MPVKLSLEEKIEITLIVGENYKTYREAADIFNNRHPDKIIHFTTVRNILTKFKTSGNVENNFKKKHQSRVADEETVNQVMLSVVENPKHSLRKRSTLLPNNVSKDTVAKILKENKFRPYKPKCIHTLKPGDFARRFEFCSLIQGELEDDPFMARRIIFSDEATFTSNGTVSSQNCRWWSDVNPNFTIKTRDQYSFKTNVWCGIYKDRVIGPFCFRQTMNSQRYLHLLNHHLYNFLHELPIRERLQIWYQQDGAPCHSTRDVRQYLQNLFNGRVIDRYSELCWPARSPDLTPLDYFLWGYLKDKVYRQRPFENVDHLERIIRETIQGITPAVIRNVLREFSTRTATCMERDGGYVEANVQ